MGVEDFKREIWKRQQQRQPREKERGGGGGGSLRVICKYE